MHSVPYLFPLFPALLCQTDIRISAVFFVNGPLYIPLKLNFIEYEKLYQRLLFS